MGILNKIMFVCSCVEVSPNSKPFRNHIRMTVKGSELRFLATSTYCQHNPKIICAVKVQHVLVTNSLNTDT